MQNLTKEWRRSHQQLFCNRQILTIIYFILVAKNHCKVQSRCLIHEFSDFTDIFNDINHGYKTALFKKKNCGCFRFIWMWLLSFFFLSFPKILHSFCLGYVSICNDLQKMIALSSGPFLQVFTFTMQCICNL